MGAQAEPKKDTKPRHCAAPSKCVKDNGWNSNHVINVIDIASLEELFKQPGPLLAEDCERYHFENDAARWPEPEPEPVARPQPQAAVTVEERIESHLRKVMDGVKARQQDEVRQRFDCAMRTAAYRVDLLQPEPVDHYELLPLEPVDHYEAYNTSNSSTASNNEKLLKDTMASLQAAKERMELRTRATAALEAAAARAANSSAAKSESTSTEAKENRSPPTRSNTLHPSKVPQPVKKGPALYDLLQARIQKALAAAHQRHASEAA
jgi:hypothetical protein